MPNVGSVSVTVVPDASQFSGSLSSQVTPQADRVGQDIGRTLADRIAAGIRSGLGDGLRNAREESSRQGRQSGDNFAGEFDRQIQTKIRAALRSLPPLNIGVATTEAEQKIRDLQADLLTLAGQRIGIDVSEEEARAKIDAIRVELDRLGAESPSVRVKMDTAAAVAQLAALQAVIDKVDLDTINIDVDVHAAEAEVELLALNAAADRTATAGLGGLVLAGLALAPAIVPVAALCVAALAGIATAAVAATAGVGVAILALKPVIGAVQALSAADQSSGANAAAAGAAAKSRASAIASANSQIQSSEASLSNTRASVAAGAVNSAQQVANAELQVAAAQRQSLVAQQALTDARKTAQQQLEDYKTQLADGALSQRAATLAIAQAKQTLDTTNSSGTSTTLQKQQAQLAYDQAVQQNTDLGIQQGRLKEQATAAAKAGVEGSQVVVAAKDKVRTAADAEVKAQQGVANAQRAQADQARQGAASIVAAQRSVATAQRSLATAYAQTSTAGVSSATKVKEAFAGLTPAGASFARFIYGLKGAFGGLSDAAQNGLLPGLQQAIKSLLPSLPGLTSFVGNVAKAFGDLLVSGTNALNGPFFKQFFAFLNRETPKWLTVLGQTLGQLATGAAGLFQAFAPVADQFNGALLSGVTQFAQFATNLGTNKGFQSFLGYIKDNLPPVLGFLGDLFRAVGSIVVALAPLGPVVLQALDGLLKFIAALSPGVMGAIAIGVGLVGGAILGVISPVAAVVIALFGFGILVTNLYKNNETFRNAVNTAWAAIKTAISTAWTDYIRPALTAIYNFIQLNLMPTIIRLWREVVVPAFTEIGQIIALVWQNIIYPALSALWLFIRDVLAPVLLYLLNNVVVPVFKQIGSAIELAWTAVIKPVLDSLKTVISGLPAAFTSARDLIGSVWNGLVDKIKGPLSTVLSFIESAFIKPLNAMLAAVGISLRLPDIPGFSGGGAVPSNTGNRPGRTVTGFDGGGWTGPGSKFQPAGVVHADEFVVQKSSQNRMRTLFPGVLDHINTHGSLPGFDAGGLVGSIFSGIGNAASSVGGFVSNAASAAVSGAKLAGNVLIDPLGALKDFVGGIVGQLGSNPFAQTVAGVIGKMTDGLVAKVTGGLGASAQQAAGGPLVQGVPGSASAASAVAYALSQANSGTSGWLDRCLAFVNAAWGHKVPWLGLPRAIDSWNAAPFKHPGDTHPPAGAALFYTTGNPAGHVDLSLGGNSIASTDLPRPDHVGVDSFNDPMTKWGARYLGWSLPAYADGGFVKPMLFDSGGILPTGVSMVRNDTGAPESLVRADRIQSSSPVNFYGNVGWDPDEVASRIEMKRADKLALHRAGMAVA